MSTVIVTLPGLEPGHAKDLVNMALAEWSHRRDGPCYIEARYGNMTEAFRERRRARLALELAALDNLKLEVLIPKETP